MGLLGTGNGPGTAAADPGPVLHRPSAKRSLDADLFYPRQRACACRRGSFARERMQAGQWLRRRATDSATVQSASGPRTCWTFRRDSEECGLALKDRAGVKLPLRGAAPDREPECLATIRLRRRGQPHFSPGHRKIGTVPDVLSPEPHSFATRCLNLPASSVFPRCSLSQTHAASAKNVRIDPFCAPGMEEMKRIVDAVRHERVEKSRHSGNFTVQQSGHCWTDARFLFSRLPMEGERAGSLRQAQARGCRMKSEKY